MSDAQTQARGDAPAVSFVVPAYRCAEYVGETLDSILAQTFQDYEIIVVNDGCPETGALERALAPYRGRIVYLTQENRGLAGARNTGLRAARAPLVMPLDADDLLEPDYLAVQVEAMREDPSLDAVYPDVLIFGDTAHAGKTYMEVNPSEGEVTFEALVTQRCVIPNFALVRRAAVERAGWYDENLRRSEDFDLWLRLAGGGGRIGYHRRVLARYRRRGDSLSADEVGMLEAILYVLDKAGREQQLSAAERGALDGARARFHAMLRFHEGKHAFMRGDTRAALAGLGEANRFFRSRKTGLAMLLMRVAPGLLLRAYGLRDRYLLKTGTGA